MIVTYYLHYLFNGGGRQTWLAKAKTSLNTRFSIAKKLKIIKDAEEKSLHAEFNLYKISLKEIQYWIQQKKENGSN